MTKPKTQMCATCKTEKRVREFTGYRYEGGQFYDINCKSCTTDKLCIQCNKRKEFKLFRSRKNKNGKIYYESICIKCESENNKKTSRKRYLTKGRKEFLDKYHKDSSFRNKLLQKSANWEKDNREHRRKYRSKPHQRNRANIWQNNKRQTDPSYKIRLNISNRINRTIKKQGLLKSGSILKYLPYTFNELKRHLESQFESWMSWDNHGKYDPKTWDNNDFNTWTWQIDHIIPHSDLPYDSMDHVNFKKAWSLENLRPLNSKKNLFDGTRRVRHQNRA